ncbi:lysyl-tRNA synthetase [Bimuria novae-zelandiae CBS 107.79]|uniref:Lysyl-tRNA synthetase n=1 Tax=Bimuria novae-zelandiae CBS 107.79 TaxID=1447943 RepID=A0A6A5V2F8_9PLEO|nr:lysyl-tRNA synthetase [Bimuria novae-zelandiae CBS 107.79]
MSRPTLHFLRPYLTRGIQPAVKPELAGAYCAFQTRSAHTFAADAYTGRHDVEKQKRLVQLRKNSDLGEYHPRLAHNANGERLSLRDFNNRHQELPKDAAGEPVSVFGRVRSVRMLGSKLMFLDIKRDSQRLQIMIEVKKLENYDEVVESFKSFKRIVSRGDWVSFYGRAIRTSTGQLSLLAIRVPQILAPCLHHLPEKVENVEVLARNPHVHQLTNVEPGEILRLRATIYDSIRQYMVGNRFLEVETPIFDVNAGGAIARPFETVANELSNTPVRLRIAPELNLKRLIVGGQDRIFEIGRVFRNEGVDNTHNPEFSTCEFYEVGATLPSLIERTEDMLCGLKAATDLVRKDDFPSLQQPEGIDFKRPFAQLPFIPTVEKSSGRKLPDLVSPTATQNLIALFEELDIDVPPNPTLPRLLDALAEKYIEPLCIDPTFITHHPEALSPLSKSYVCPETNQRIASRVELFINGREYVNAYEEENSPFEQRRKFMQQLEFHPETGEGSRELDESYLEVLEWGMPPTGGWGCGLDRLVMLFANKKRIADVLPFGTLRNVVSIAKNR